MAKGSFDIQISGHAPARRDVELEITSESTGETRRIKPFLDGSAKVRDLLPGSYEVKVLHPNVVGSLVDLRKVRLFDGVPTRVRFPLPDDLFRDVPDLDPVEADLTPVQATATASRDLANGLDGKQPGDPIRSEDWNALVAAVSDLASAVAQITRLVAPRGHDHPELDAQVDAVESNVRRFSDHFGRQIAQLQRQLQALSTRRQVDDLLAVATVVPDSVRTRLTGAVRVLEQSATSDTIRYGSAKKGAYQQVLDTLVDLVDAQQDPSPLELSAPFDFLVTVASEETTRSQPRSVEGEVAHFETINRKTAGAIFRKALG